MGMPDSSTTSTSNPNRYLSVKSQYVISYNGSRKTPNWTAWQLNKSWMGSTSRQDTFRPDNTLPTSIPQASLADYSGSGYDRGHMCPSADRPLNTTDNSNTFYLTNMLPQAPNNNQGPWEQLQSYSRTLVSSGKELFIMSGPIEHHHQHARHRRRHAQQRQQDLQERGLAQLPSHRALHRTADRPELHGRRRPERAGRHRDPGRHRAVIAEGMEEHPRLRGLYKPRGPRFVSRAKDEQAHCGYQEWHREVDDEVVRWLKHTPGATPKEFMDKLREIYGRPEMIARFPHGF